MECPVGLLFLCSKVYYFISDLSLVVFPEEVRIVKPMLSHIIKEFQNPMILPAKLLWSHRKYVLFQIIIMLFIVLPLCGNGTAETLTLAWDANIETNLDSYKLYYSVNSSNPITCDQGPSPITIPVSQLANPNAPSFKLTGFPAGYTYFFVTTAVNKLGVESDDSNLVSHMMLSSTDTGLTESSVSGTISGQDNTSVTGNASGIVVEEGLASKFETKEILVDHNWKRVNFQKTYTHPVVVAGDPSLNGSEPVVVRIDNVTSTGFDICLQEWDYQDDRHTEESVGYIVMESGMHELPDGTLVYAGTLTTNATRVFKHFYFEQVFNTSPILCATATTFNDADTITIRIRNVNTQGFQMEFQEQEANTGLHSTETVSYIAWEPSQGQIDGIAYEINKTSPVVTHSPYSIFINQYFSSTPSFISAMQTCNGSDTASLRWQEKTTDGINIQVAEEQSRDSETYHIEESIGYMLFHMDF